MCIRGFYHCRHLIDHLCNLLDHVLLFLWKNLQDFDRFISFSKDYGWGKLAAIAMLWNLVMISFCSEIFVKNWGVKLWEWRPGVNTKMWFCFLSVCQGPEIKWKKKGGGVKAIMIKLSHPFSTPANIWQVLFYLNRALEFHHIHVYRGVVTILFPKLINSKEYVWTQVFWPYSVASFFLPCTLINSSQW